MPVLREQCMGTRTSLLFHPINTALLHCSFFTLPCLSLPLTQPCSPACSLPLIPRLLPVMSSQQTPAQTSPPLDHHVNVNTTSTYISSKVSSVAKRCTDEQLFQLRLSTIFAGRSLIYTVGLGVRANLVVGSLGIGTQAPFWEWGGPEYQSLEQFLQPIQGDSACDAYMWVQDEAGLIYDVVNQYKIDVADIQSKVILTRLPQMLHGVSYAEAERLGFHYLPAAADLQIPLKDAMMRDSDRFIMVIPDAHHQAE